MQSPHFDDEEMEVPYSASIYTAVRFDLGLQTTIYLFISAKDFRHDYADGLLDEEAFRAG